MHDILRERLLRGLEALPEDRLYQVLDYIEFLGSKYARDKPTPAASPFRRFSEKLEDHMRMQGVGLNAIKGTLGIMGSADRVMNDVASAGRNILKEVEDTLLPPPATRDAATPGDRNDRLPPPRDRRIVDNKGE